MKSIVIDNTKRMECFKTGWMVHTFAPLVSLDGIGEIIGLERLEENYFAWEATSKAYRKWKILNPDLAKICPFRGIIGERIPVLEPLYVWCEKIPQQDGSFWYRAFSGYPLLYANDLEYEPILNPFYDPEGRIPEYECLWVKHSPYYMTERHCRAWCRVKSIEIVEICRVDGHEAAKAGYDYPRVYAGFLDSKEMLLRELKSKVYIAYKEDTKENAEEKQQANTLPRYWWKINFDPIFEKSLDLFRTKNIHG